MEGLRKGKKKLIWNTLCSGRNSNFQNTDWSLSQKQSTPDTILMKLELRSTAAVSPLSAHTYLRHGRGLASLHFVWICGVERGRSRKLGWHIKGGKNDDNKKRVMVPGSAKRVATSRIERKKNSCRRMGPDDDIQDVRSEDGTGSGLPCLLSSFSSYFLLCWEGENLWAVYDIRVTNI